MTHDQEEALAICDQVAVMRQGKLEQIGTPEAIYTQPASRFVAEFVTQANFLPAKRQGNYWETEIGKFEASKTPQTVDKGELMLREEDILLQAQESASIIIHDRYFLGREYRYCLETPSGQRLHARTTASTPLPIGTRVQLSIVPQTPQIFSLSEQESNNLAVSNH